MSCDLDELFTALARSRFRSRFRLGPGELKYLQEKGLEAVLQHAADFIEQRLAPAEPRNDGRQTPWRGHPVFIAQHATGTCCRSCLAKWHHFPRGVELTPEAQDHIVKTIERWLKNAIESSQPPEQLPGELGLFA